MMKLCRLRKDEAGMGAVEFALVAPALIGFIVGIGQLGILFFANADLNNAVAAGARIAVVFPKPSDDTIKAQMTASSKQLKASRLGAPTVVHGTDSSGREYADLSMTYSVPLDFVLFKTPAVTLRSDRRVFLQPPVVAPTVGSSSTSAGGTTTTPPGGTTTTPPGGTTTSSNGGGNSNGNSDNHDHGNCNKKC